MRSQATTTAAALFLCFIVCAWIAVRNAEAAEGEASPDTLEAGDSVPVEAIDARRSWRMSTIDVEGLNIVQRFLYLPKLSTPTRPWWVFWRDYPDFAPTDFEADVKKVRRSLEAAGFYDAQVRGDVQVLRKPAEEEGGEPGLVRGRIAVELGERVYVCSLDIQLGAIPIPQESMRRLRKDLAIVVGQAFTESDYQGAGEQIAGYLGENGYALAKVDRKARVDMPRRCADVTYKAEPGQIAVFGETQIQGLESVDPEIAKQELAYEPGDTYDARKTTESIRRLRGLHLFTIVRLEPEGITPEGEAPMRLTLAEGPPREVRFGVGYSTDEGVRGLASWSHYNLFGGGQQFTVSGRISEIRRSVNASFLQPYFPASSMKTLVNFTLGQDDESTYLDDYARIVPRIDWRAGDEINVNFFVTGGYDSLSGVSDQSIAALPGFVNSGFTVAPGVGVRWTHLDDAVNPTRGVVLGTSAEVASRAFGGDFGWYRLVADSRAYQPVYGDLVLATRLIAGTIVPYGGTDQIQFWDRFYAGGTSVNSVRGYPRRRVGPLSDSNDPIGGRSAVVGSLELRYPLFGPIQGVVFADAGDVELSAWQFQVQNVQTGVGFGVRANSPVGPVELDLGFGLNRRAAPGFDPDSLVQFHFTLGPNF